MGTCCSTPAVAGRPSRTYSGPLPAPMQDQVNAVLNRWRHGEVNLLARKFRQARDCAANAAHNRGLGRLASRIMQKAAGASAGAGGTAGIDKSLAGPATFDGSDADTREEGAVGFGVNCSDVERLPDCGVGSGGSGRSGGSDGTAAGGGSDAPTLPPSAAEAPTSRPPSMTKLLDASARSAKAAGGSKTPPMAATPSAHVALASAGNGAVAGGTGGGPAAAPPLKRRGLTREGLAAVFPLLTRLPEASREAAFAVFDSQGRGTVDFRDFCRALALCSRGTRLERLRFLFDLFCSAGPKHSGKQLGPCDLPEGAGAALAAAEAAALCKYCGIMTTPALAAHPMDGGEARLELMAFFDWAEENVPEDVLDRALEPFYLLPSPQQEKEMVLQILRARVCGSGGGDDGAAGGRNSLKRQMTAVAAAAPTSTAAANGSAEVTDAASGDVAGAVPEAAKESERTAPEAPAMLFQAGDTVFAVSAKWWLQWARFVALTPADLIGLPPSLGKCLLDGAADGSAAAAAAAGGGPAAAAGVSPAKPVRENGHFSTTPLSTAGGAAPTPALSSAPFVASVAGAGAAAAGRAATPPATPATGAASAAGRHRASLSPPRRAHMLVARPHEMDNSPLQGKTEWELKPGLASREGELFVLWPRELWESMNEWYGGGPVFARRVVEIAAADAAGGGTLVLGPIPAPAIGPVGGGGGGGDSSTGKSRGVAAAASDGRRLLAVDLYPAGFHINVCDSSGWPGTRERLVFASKHNTLDQTVDDIFDSFGLPRPVRHFGDEDGDVRALISGGCGGGDIVAGGCGGNGGGAGSGADDGTSEAATVDGAATANSAGVPAAAPPEGLIATAAARAMSILTGGGGGAGAGKAAGAAGSTPASASGSAAGSVASSPRIGVTSQAAAGLASAGGGVGAAAALALPSPPAMARLWVLELSRDGLMDHEAPTVERRPSLQPLKAENCGGGVSTSSFDLSASGSSAHGLLGLDLLLVADSSGGADVSRSGGGGGGVGSGDMQGVLTPRPRHMPRFSFGGGLLGQDAAMAAGGSVGPGSGAAAAGGGAGAADAPAGGGAAASGGAGTGPNAVMRWRLLTSRQHRSTLAALRLQGGEKLMLEVWRDGTDHGDGESGGGGWPRAVHVEKPGWRRFALGDRVDAMDYQGRWYPGSVVNVEQVSTRGEGAIAHKKKRSGGVDLAAAGGAESGTQTPQQPSPKETAPGTVAAAAATAAMNGQALRTRVRVHFDRFSSQWDEWYDAMSCRLAPETSQTAPASVPPAPQVPRASTPAGAPGLANGARSPGEDGDDDEPPPAAGVAIGSAAAAGAAAAAGGTTFTNGGAMIAAGRAAVIGRPPRHSATTLPPPLPAVQRTYSGSGVGNGSATNITALQRPPSGAGTPNGSAAGGGAGSSATVAAPAPAAASGPAPEGISNYANVALSRRANTPGKPPLPGACGLVNLGNTCYMNAGVQCLGHTPLLRAYILSDMYVPEINKNNPLSTQGKLMEEFAGLMKQLWSEEFLCVFPSKFKRGLIKFKSQFAGNEQQDSAEFLAELVDLLHEDVNRVIDKPYTVPPEDDVLATMSQVEVANEAWERHLTRNRSVFVDLFQGQTKTSCKCVVCGHESLTFDPLMYLNLQIPLRNEKMVAVVVLRRIRSSRNGGVNGGKIGLDVLPAGGGAAALGGDGIEYEGDAMTAAAAAAATPPLTPRDVVPERYGMMLPRLSEMVDLRQRLSQLCGIAPECLVLTDIYKHKLHKVLDDAKPLTILREDDLIVAYEIPKPPPPDLPDPALGLTGPTAAATAAAFAPAPLPASAPTPAAAVAVVAATTATAMTGSGSAAGAVAARPAAAVEVAAAAAVEVAAAAAAAADVSAREGNDLEDFVPAARAEAAGAPDVNRTSLDEHSIRTFPARFCDLKPGQRLDALDNRGKWYAGTVEEVLAPPEGSSTGSSNGSHSGGGGGSFGAASLLGSGRVGRLLNAARGSNGGGSSGGGQQSPAAAAAAAAVLAAAATAGTVTVRAAANGDTFDAATGGGGDEGAATSPIAAEDTPAADGSTTSSSAAAASGGAAGGATAPVGGSIGGWRVKVHYDRFAHKWDEWFTQEHWDKDNLKPLYTHVRRMCRPAEFAIVHRKTVKHPTAAPSTAAGAAGPAAGAAAGYASPPPPAVPAPSAPGQWSGSRFMLGSSSHHRAQSSAVASLLPLDPLDAAAAGVPLAAAAPSVAPAGESGPDAAAATPGNGAPAGAAAGTAATAAVATAPVDKELFGLPLYVHCDGARSTRYLWRLVVQQAARFIRGPPAEGDDYDREDEDLDENVCDDGGSVVAVASGGDDGGGGDAGSGSKITPSGIVVNSGDSSKRPRPVSSAEAAAAVAGGGGMTDEELARRLPFRVRVIVADAPASDTASANLVPDPLRSVASVAFPRVMIALDWADPARDYLDALAETRDDPTVKQVEEAAAETRGGVTLQDCLDAFTKEERLEEEAWMCPRCKKPRQAVMRNELWKMPDVLIVFLKRFQSSARWREKIRLLVVFPHSGLDLSPYVCAASEHASSAGQGGLVYDLFAVVNHMGGMTGGHYTACCRSTPCSRDGVEEVGVWGMEHPWLHFDDEFVEEIAPDKIVNEAAYVLFYRRRRLTPSNVINMTI